ncbi:hypothetical protein [Methylotenera sp.]|uniref:hypothetical protein n=1 Tax=Methylotenera sp. TaxID=2051956 RepID=UPI00271E0826|nr:hypothetical protein [Methylotenera sp.]MDO9204778.1 hypothetical protein [Methylotenera sp.]MDP2070294.1 hypothetical protein [Methylotenera sp.]MDP2230561.1 hypothetical protein [Methylotenera sp.]MDP3005279.1 hypothetical protein [Methylotenera sp.]MDP3141426.1 hypothetical protein [Methylotenera sp.]
MAHQYNYSSQANSRLRQGGAVLILMAFILGLGAAAYLLKAYNADAAKAKQDEKTYQALGAAKQALLAWAVSHPNTPGLMPYPDRNGDGNYDGNSDCYTGVFQYGFLLGQLPTVGQTNPCVTPQTGLGGDWRDSQGNRLWYAVSRNLVHDYEHSESPVINPGMNNPPHAVTPYLRQGGIQSYPWLKVLDRNGNLVSDRVAAVILAPGSPIGGQNRSAFAPNASEYLDSFQKGAAIYNNRAYATADEDFVIGEDSSNVPASDLTFVQPYQFNDKLVYITIDELMATIEKRVGREVGTQLKDYYVASNAIIANRFYPYAAIMGGNKNYSCVVGKLAGALPVAASHSSSCSYTGISATSSTSSCSFAEVEAVIFTKTSLNFTYRAGACQFSGKICTCSGAGTCTRATQQFICDAAGECSANVAGSYQFTGGGFDSVTGKCSTSCGSDISCSGTGGGMFTHSSCTDAPFNDVTTNSILPIWFTDNLWQDYVYYAAQRGVSPTLSAGGINGITALTVTTGYSIAIVPFASKGSAQVRLSCNLSDHMDTNVNATGDATNIYELTNKPRSRNYNDQIFVVSP